MAALSMASAALIGNDFSNADPTSSFAEIRASSIPLASQNGQREAKKRRLVDESLNQPKKIRVAQESNLNAEYESDADSCEEQSELEERTHDAAEINSVIERLSVLQHLLPHGLELEEDEILRVAVEYVKELEKEIQTFDVSSKDWFTPNHGTDDDTPLQKRGLCIVPLSTLAQAL